MSPGLGFAASWGELVDQSAHWLTEAQFGVFDSPRVIVGSRGAARLLSQELASRLPGRICAGVGFLTVPRWIRAVAAEAGVAPHLERWHPAQLELAVWQELRRMETSGQFSALGHYLSPPEAAGPRPHRALSVARRVTRLLLAYLQHHPAVVKRWAEGEDVLDGGQPVPPHQGWQPELVRRLISATGTNPVALYEELGVTLSGRTGVPTLIAGIGWPTTVERWLLDASRQDPEVSVIGIDGPPGSTWPEPVRAPAEPAGPVVEVHGSHDVYRQVQVLRDVLCRYLEEDPTLEPRDVAIVAPQPQDWTAALQSVFAPTDGDQDHPARGLRLVIPSAALEANVVLRCLARILRLPDSRSTSEELVELLTMAPIARRWRFEHAKLVELVAGVEVRWGLDEQHRAHLGLPGISQNTWTRGLDRLLLSVALGGRDAGLQIAGVETVSSTDTDIIGRLSEVISRLRRFAHISGRAAPPSEWAERMMTLCNELFEPGGEDGRMLSQTIEKLASLAEETASVSTTLTRGEFSRVFEGLLAEPAPRPSIGNGSMQLLRPGEVYPASHRVVCFLGIEDEVTVGMPDQLMADLPDPQRVMLDHIAAQARAAERVAFLYQARTATNTPLARPTSIGRILAGLGANPIEYTHPPSPRDPSQFAPFSSTPSFDAVNAAAAERSRRHQVPALVDEAHDRRAYALDLDDDLPATEPLRPQDLTAFLRDPAAGFLRYRAGLRLFSAPALSTEVPLEVRGLEAWQIRENLLRALMAGSSLPVAAAAQRLRETLPPGKLGWGELNGLTTDVELLWERAHSAWQAPRVDHAIDVDQLRGRVTTRGGQIVHITSSGAAKALLGAWVELLTLAASGIETEAVVHQLVTHHGTQVAQTTTLTPPENAARLLSAYVRAARVGRGRLLPVPPDPALALVESVLSTGSIEPAAWNAAADDWKGIWPLARRGSAWSLFYDGPANQLFSSVPHPRDQLLPGGSYGAFGAWARTLYEPLITSRRVVN